MKYAWTLAICLAVLCLAAPSEAAPQKTLRDAHVDLACADCHIGQKNPKQAGAISCAKCHDAEYSKMMAEWKTDVNKSVGTLREIISKINMDNDAEVIEAKNLINKISAYRSLYVHNYGLISDLLSQKKKALEKYAK